MRWQHGGTDVLSESALRLAEEHFNEDTGDTAQAPVPADRNPNPVEASDDPEDPEDWDNKEGGGRSLSIGAIGLLAITVVMAFF